MPLYLLERQKEIWQFSPKLSPEDNVSALLVKMAIFRQARWEPISLELFTQYLVNLDLRAFQVAMAILAENKREDGETALPSLGKILAVMDEAREIFPIYSQGAKEVNTTPFFAIQAEKRQLKA